MNCGRRKHEFASLCRSFARGVVVVSFAAMLNACKGVQSASDVAGIQNQHIHTMWITLLAVCGLMYGLVLIFLIAALLRLRRQQSLAPQAVETQNTPMLTQLLRGWVALIVAGLSVSRSPAMRSIAVYSKPIRRKARRLK